MLKPADPLAREFAAQYFEAQGRSDLSNMVRRGEGDDFAEVQSASSLMDIHAEKLARYEAALKQYAEPDFWEEMPGGSLAAHDGGEMARNVLRGRPAFYHRD